MCFVKVEEGASELSSILFPKWCKGQEVFLASSSWFVDAFCSSNTFPTESLEVAVKTLTSWAHFYLSPKQSQSANLITLKDCGGPYLDPTIFFWLLRMSYEKSQQNICLAIGAGVGSFAWVMIFHVVGSIITDGRSGACERKDNTFCTEVYKTHFYFLCSLLLRVVHQLWLTTHKKKEHHDPSREGTNLSRGPIYDTVDIMRTTSFFVSRLGGEKAEKSSYSWKKTNELTVSLSNELYPRVSRKCPSPLMNLLSFINEPAN